VRAQQLFLQCIVMADLSKALIIDDHPLFREALVSAVSLAYPIARSVEACDITAALAVLETDRDFDIAMLDLNIPGVQGFEGLLKLRSLHPRLPILVVSAIENEQVIDEAITYGAAGFLPKSLGREVLATAIRTILEGAVYLPEGLPSSGEPVDYLTWKRTFRDNYSLVMLQNSQYVPGLCAVSTCSGIRFSRDCQTVLFPV